MVSLPDPYSLILVSASELRSTSADEWAVFADELLAALLEKSASNIRLTEYMYIVYSPVFYDMIDIRVSE